MKPRTIIISCILLTLFSCNLYEKNSDVLKSDYNIENWSGKDGVVKGNIEFPIYIIDKYDLSLNIGSDGNSFSYKIPFENSDTIEYGKLSVTVFPTIEEAQLGLEEYLLILQTPFKPPRLTGENLVGDVAFGQEINNEMRINFTRCNMFIIVHAATDQAYEISNAIDEPLIIGYWSFSGAKTKGHV